MINKKIYIPEPASILPSSFFSIFTFEALSIFSDLDGRFSSLIAMVSFSSFSFLIFFSFSLMSALMSWLLDFLWLDDECEWWLLFDDEEWCRSLFEWWLDLLRLDLWCLCFDLCLWSLSSSSLDSTSAFDCSSISSASSSSCSSSSDDASLSLTLKI